MRHGTRIFAVTFAFICVAGMGAACLGAQPVKSSLSDKERLRACDSHLCALVNKPNPNGPSLTCDLSETWHKKEIGEAVAKGHLSWPFGDAHCSMTLAVSRALLAPALTRASYKLKVPPQPVECEVETGSGPHVVKANMAPEVEFEHGKAKYVSLGLQDIDGSVVVRNVVWAAWKFESNFGFFQKDFVNGVNRYIGEHCPSPGHSER